jgi:phage tail-like protein
LALALPLPLAWLPATRREAVAAVPMDRFGRGGVGLLLHGAAPGAIKSARGGNVVAAVLEEGTARGAATKKHLGAVGYEDITLEVGLALDRSFYDWIGASWRGTPTRKSGTVVSYDQNLSAQSSREFTNALISETTCPTLSAQSKDAGLLTVKLSPERVKDVAGAVKSAGLASKDARGWIASNFRLELDGLDCSRVSKIDSFSVKQAVTSSAAGAARELAKEPAKLSFGDLKVTLARAGSDSWRSWHDDFVVAGKSSEQNEKSGRIVLLGPSLKEELAEIKLFNVGIYALRNDAGQGLGELEAALYVERMEFTVKR